MKCPRASVVALSAAVLLSFPLQADWTKIPATDFSVDKPPKDGSSKHRQELEAIRDWQDARTENDCEEASSQLDATMDSVFVDSGAITASEASHVEGLLNRVLYFTEDVTGHFKDKFKRKRPFAYDSSIEPCIELPSPKRSYPSGHTAKGAVGACVLSRLFPDRADEIEKAGRRAGELRLIAGVHYPSDIEAGRNLAADICNRLFDEADFEEEIQDLL